MVAGLRRRASRSAEWRISHGAIVRPKRSSTERRQPERTFRRWPRPCCEMTEASTTTTLRSSWRGAESCVHWRRRFAGPRNRKQISGSSKRETSMTATTNLGNPTSRIEGRAKVTGMAKYAADYHAPGLAHGFVVSSAIAKGRITGIHTADALAVDGVLAVFT